MTIREIIILISIAVLYASCKEDSPDTIGGYAYEIFTSEGDRKAVIGEFVHFNLISRQFKVFPKFKEVL